MTTSSLAEVAARHGFALERSEELAEIKGTAHVMRHERSGARLLFLCNDDPNKAFSISFKTPAADDTGVFHILEHSVLCGSRKFPTKEPFVNLLKTSMQTFLNAMTFPDKTMYPVSSTNEQDLQNLMEVYLDAVFQPAIYDKRTIFEQEGWHLELAPGTTDELVFNGVVYNEMKGALSDPDSVLYDALSAALFPDTTYRFESGGTPEAIPTLTYESYLDTHARHYRPDNSYITLYGDLDPDRFLGFISREYLEPLADEKRGPLDVNPLALQTEVVARGVRVPMDTAPENACAALGFVIGPVAERERIVATDILLDAIAGSNEAPLKRALLNAGLAADAQAFVADSIAQPFAMLSLRGLTAEPGVDALERFESVVRTEAQRLADGGLDRSLVTAALSHAEFVMREHNFGYPDGVACAVSAMAGWLYDDALATDYLRYEDVFASLRAKVDEGYFEDLLRELLLGGRHWASVELVPTEGCGAGVEQQCLDALAARMDAAGFQAVQAQVDALRAVQEAPDAPADLAKLPRLAVGDIGDAAAEASFALQEDPGEPCLRHAVETNGILYASRYFPLESVSFDELPYVGVLGLVLGRLGTAQHTAAELDTLIQAHLGTLSFFAEVHEDALDRGAFKPMMVASVAALEEEAEAAAALASEVMLETDFSDVAKIADMLMQKRVAMEQGFATAGHSVAAQRAASYFLPAAVVRQQLGGLDFYWFLRDLIEHFDERASQLSAKLAELAGRLFSNRGHLLSFAGSDEALARYRAAWPSLGAGKGSAEPALQVPEPVNRREALIVPTDVSFSSLAFDRRLVEGAPPYGGAWLLASRFLSYDYLWNEVRVKGGAYGCGFSATRPGVLSFHSFRDPHLDQTVERFQAAGPWLAALDPTADEMEGYVVSTTAAFDAPLKPRDLIRRQAGMFLSGVTPAMREEVRRQIVGAAPADVRALGDAVARAADAGCLCTVGSADIIQGSDLGLDAIDLMGGR